MKNHIGILAFAASVAMAYGIAWHLDDLFPAPRARDLDRRHPAVASQPWTVETKLCEAEHDAGIDLDGVRRWPDGPSSAPPPAWTASATGASTASASAPSSLEREATQARCVEQVQAPRRRAP